MRGRPAVVLGVNSDGNPSAADVARREGLVERSWRDGGEVYGGEIARRWNVRGLPTTYVIDRRGIIRYKLGQPPDARDPVAEVLDAAGRPLDRWRKRFDGIAAVVDALIAEGGRNADAVPLPSPRLRPDQDPGSWLRISDSLPGPIPPLAVPLDPFAEVGGSRRQGGDLGVIGGEGRAPAGLAAPGLEPADPPEREHG